MACALFKKNRKGTNIMGIEKDLARIASALERIAAAVSQGPVAEKPETKAAEKPETKAAEKPETKAAEKPETKKAAEKPETKAAVEPEVAKAEEPEVTKAEEPEVAKAEESVPSLDDVVAALQKYMKANGRDAAVELLAKYEAKRASDIAEEKRADFVKEAA
jgi:chromatin remodeling complex protein RSC6